MKQSLAYLLTAFTDNFVSSLEPFITQLRVGPETQPQISATGCDGWSIASTVGTLLQTRRRRPIANLQIIIRGAHSALQSEVVEV